VFNALPPPACEMRLEDASLLRGTGSAAGKCTGRDAMNGEPALWLDARAARAEARDVRAATQRVRAQVQLQRVQRRARLERSELFAVLTAKATSN